MELVTSLCIVEPTGLLCTYIVVIHYLLKIHKDWFIFDVLIMYDFLLIIAQFLQRALLMQKSVYNINYPG